MRAIRGPASGRSALVVLATAPLLLWLSCADPPLAPEDQGSFQLLAGKGDKPGKPPKCDASTPLLIELVSGALQGDGFGNVYREGEYDVGSHLAINGNLMLWTSQYGSTIRHVNVTVELDGDPDPSTVTIQTTDRIYTNDHRASDGSSLGCGFADMDPDSSGDAVFEIELGSTGDIVRYGKDCSGDTVDASRVSTTGSGAGQWTISGTSGVYCKNQSERGKPRLEQQGTAGPFIMTLEAVE